MIDASKGFKKDGNKNRLREQDIHRIVDSFDKQVDLPRYARMVGFEEIADPKNDYNLNLPRYIDSTEPEDLQDIEGHLRGGIPERDLGALDAYWQVIPKVRSLLFQGAERHGYYHLQVPINEVKSAILNHPEFVAFNAQVMAFFEQWQQRNIPKLQKFDQGDQPKTLIAAIAEDLLDCFAAVPLLDAYDLYQHLMDYWAETMQDDCYILAADGWVAQTYRVVETDKKGRTKDKGWACDLVPKSLIVAHYFATQESAIASKQSELEAIAVSITELEEEHGGEEGYLGALEKVNKAEVNSRLKVIKGDRDADEEMAVLRQWLKLGEDEASCKRAIKDMDAELDRVAYAKYASLTKAEVKTLVIDHKWLPSLGAAVRSELDRLSQTLTGRVRLLAERYATPLPMLEQDVADLSARVAAHLQKMGFR